MVNCKHVSLGQAIGILLQDVGTTQIQSSEIFERKWILWIFEYRVVVKLAVNVYIVKIYPLAILFSLFNLQVNSHNSHAISASICIGHSPNITWNIIIILRILLYRLHIHCVIRRCVFIIAGSYNIIIRPIYTSTCYYYDIDFKIRFLRSNIQLFYTDIFHSSVWHTRVSVNCRLRLTNAFGYNKFAFRWTDSGY